MSDFKGFKAENRVDSKIEAVLARQKAFAIKSSKSGYVTQLERDGLTGEECSYAENNRLFIEFFGGRSFVNNESSLPS